MNNEKQQLKNKSNLKHRSFYFSLEVIKFLERLPKNYIYQILGKQLLRAATSVGANIIEAQAGRTKRDFTNFYQISLKSANETKYWLSLLKEKIRFKIQQTQINKLIQEITEISNMLAASLLTLKGKRNC